GARFIAQERRGEKGERNKQSDREHLPHDDLRDERQTAGNVFFRSSNVPTESGGGIMVRGAEYVQQIQSSRRGPAKRKRRKGEEPSNRCRVISEGGWTTTAAAAASPARRRSR